jgi:hypothetical protein
MAVGVPPTDHDDLGEMEEWRTWLRTVADHLEDIERRVREAPDELDV